MISDIDLRRVREEVGASSPPTDDDIDDLWGELTSVPAVALAILRPRLADALKAAADGSFSVPGAISVSAPAQPTMLLGQIQRLEGVLAQETGSAEEGAVGGVVLMRRRDQLRGLPLTP